MGSSVARPWTLREEGLPWVHASRDHGLFEGKGCRVHASRDLGLFERKGCRVHALRDHGIFSCFRPCSLALLARACALCVNGFVHALVSIQVRFFLHLHIRSTVHSHECGAAERGSVGDWEPHAGGGSRTLLKREVAVPRGVASSSRFWTRATSTGVSSRTVATAGSSCFKSKKRQAGAGPGGSARRGQRGGWGGSARRAGWAGKG